ncbi:hypothetical protein N1851_025923 [Merluccius polli]|uniref:Uncharacterized protein n=1 Tax=Merluccius polli TaxID=89951 RepID=A0AA47MCV0_MERPO|nr:hypothetical protein N1851_025923 [Merluccius polli]
MTTLEEFLRAPSEELLERCSREQLVRIAEHFKMDVGDKRLKEKVKNILKENLLEAGVFQPKLYAGGSGVDTADVSVSEVGVSTGLTLEQRKELLLLQVEIKKLEERRVSLANVGQVSVSPGPSHAFVSETRTLFSYFLSEWPKVDFGLMLSARKAQEAYSALSTVESKVYVSIKAAVLKAYELVPEAYRQRFRSWERSSKQTHMEFSRELITQLIVGVLHWGFIPMRLYVT